MPTSTQVPLVGPVAAAQSANKRAISFRTTMLWLLYFASSSPAARAEAPGGKPMGAGPVASIPEWYREGSEPQSLHRTLLRPEEMVDLTEVQ